MRILEILKKKNRTVLEMHLGILAYGLLLTLIVLLVGNNLMNRLLSVLLGITLSMWAVCHMHHTLDRALDLDEGGASTRIFRGYLVRYSVLLVLLAVLGVTGALSPLLVFLSYMSLKVGAYLQPFIHIICNKLFHESDPVPEPMPEETADRT